MAIVSVCELLVGGMTCAACTGAVHGALLKQPGVLQAEVEILRETAKIVYDNSFVTPEELCAVVQGLGFEAQVLQIFFSHSSTPAENASRTTTGSADETVEAHALAVQNAFRSDGHYEEPSGFPSAVSRGHETAHPESSSICSTASIRFAFPDDGGRSLEAACRNLERGSGVIGCSVISMQHTNTHLLRQMIVTYNPVLVGARELLDQLAQQGFRPSVFTEDPIETQKQAVLNMQASLKSTLLLSFFPALVVVWLSIMGRVHNLPPFFLYEILPGIRVSTMLLVLFSAPIQFYGGRVFHASALKGLQHGHCSMDLLVSLGSTLAFFYSLFSCIQAAASTLWCRPLLMAAHMVAEGGNNATQQRIYRQLVETAEPQTFFDTCAMLICVLLFGKLLQLGSKARILTQLHSLYSLQARKVRIVLRSSNKAVAEYLQSANKLDSPVASPDEANSQDKLLLDISCGATEVGLRSPAEVATPPLPWWSTLHRFFQFDTSRPPQHKYTPLTQPALHYACNKNEEGEKREEIPICCEKKNKIKDRQQATGPAEAIISADLLQIGDVVKVEPHEAIPADGVLLAPDVLHVDERVVSGEGHAISRLVGQRVIGGSRNASHVRAFVKVEVIGEASVLQTLRRLVHSAQQQQVPLQSLAQSFAQYFIPAVLCITLASFAVWSVRLFAASDQHPLSPLQQLRQQLREAQQQDGLSNYQQQQQQQADYHSFLGVSVPRSPPSAAPVPADEFHTASGAPSAAAAAAACKLSRWAVAWDVILFALRFGVAVCCAGCPCAIGLAAPAALAAATAAAAARGIFFKSGKALETAAKTNVLVLDKTGTITTGELQVSACALHTKRLRELLLPAMTARGATFHSEQESQRVRDSPVSVDALSLRSPSATQTPGRPCCCTSSTKQSGSASFSGSLLGSMASDVTLDDTPPPHHINSSSTKQNECSSLLAQDACSRGPLAFFRLGPLTNTKEMEEIDNRCCGTTLEGLLQEEAVQAPETALETGCFLWALSCLEQGSSHCVGVALKRVYDTWRKCSYRDIALKAQQSLHAEDKHLEEAETNKTGEAGSEDLPPPQPCENMVMLPRGIQGLLRPKNAPALWLRVTAARSKEGAKSCCSSAAAVKGLSNKEDFQLEEWTKWHESHTGPVVHLHAISSVVHTTTETHPQPAFAESDWVWLGSIALQDEIQEDAQLALKYLQQVLHFKVCMCTGDNPRTAARVASSIGIPKSCVRAQQTPEQKVLFLRCLSSLAHNTDLEGAQGDPQATASDGSLEASTAQQLNLNKKTVCCMIGDGLNDSPALAAAALGVAFGVGHALPLAAADVVVGGSSWTEIVDLFRIARRMRSIIQWNFVWACAFNLIAVPLAAGVAYPTVSVHPAAAAAAMAGSCLLVLVNAQRLSRFKPMTTEQIMRELSRQSVHYKIRKIHPNKQTTELVSVGSLDGHSSLHSLKSLPHIGALREAEFSPAEACRPSDSTIVGSCRSCCRAAADVAEGVPEVSNTLGTCSREDGVQRPPPLSAELLI